MSFERRGCVPISAGMKPHLTLALALALAAAPLAAQEAGTETAPGDGDGLNLMERGAELFWEGLRQEMAPAIEDLRDMAETFGPSMRSFIEEMGPAFAEMVDQVKDWTAYHPPEMLPNGDIILRKKTPDEMAPEAQPDTPPENGADQPPAGATDI